MEVKLHALLHLVTRRGRRQSSRFTSQEEEHGISPNVGWDYMQPEWNPRILTRKYEKKNIAMVKVCRYLMLMIPYSYGISEGMLQKICQESHFERWNPQVLVILREAIIIKVRRRAGRGLSFPSSFCFKWIANKPTKQQIASSKRCHWH